jgi:hypothetical protein
MNVKIAPSDGRGLFPTRSIEVTKLTFDREDPATGEAVTALAKNGEIRYPDYPSITPVSISASDFIILDELKNFSIDEMTLNPDQRGIHLRLRGIAGRVKTGTALFRKDNRLSVLSWAQQSPVSVTMVWLGPLIGVVLYAAIEAHKIIEEHKRR